MNFEKTFRQFQKKWRQGKYRQQVQKISIGTGAVCAVLLIAYFMQSRQEEQAIETLRQIRDEASEESGNPDLVLGDQQILAQYQELFMQNPDLIGWLTIDGTDIDLPVVQTPGNNEYYLRRGFDRLYATGGTLFMDEHCSIDLDAPTANWLIYGHNMADGSMFGQLTCYRSEDFYKAHTTFTFNTIYETAAWQVVAALDTTLGADELPYYTFFDADTKLEWQQRVDAITALSLYDTGVTPAYGQQLLVLSTCGTSSPTAKTRFALLAVRCGEN